MKENPQEKEMPKWTKNYSGDQPVTEHAGIYNSPGTERVQREYGESKMVIAERADELKGRIRELQKEYDRLELAKKSLTRLDDLLNPEDSLWDVRNKFSAIKFAGVETMLVFDDKGGEKSIPVDQVIEVLNGLDETAREIVNKTSSMDRDKAREEVGKQVGEYSLRATRSALHPDAEMGLRAFVQTKLLEKIEAVKGNARFFDAVRDARPPQAE